MFLKIFYSFFRANYEDALCGKNQQPLTQFDFRENVTLYKFFFTLHIYYVIKRKKVTFLVTFF